MSAALAWAVAIPLFGAGACLGSGRRVVRWVAASTVVGTVLVAAAVAGSVSAYGTVRHAIGGWGAPLGIELRADGIAAFVLLVGAVVGAVVSVGPLARACQGVEDRRFLSLWFLAWAAVNAIFLSADVFNLYVSLELATLASVGLVASGGDREAVRAALRYLLLALPGSLLYLLGVGVLYAAFGALDLVALGARVTPTPDAGFALALMTSGLCLKAALFPLHGWLPAVYVQPRVEVSAFLAALIGKGSFYVLLRVWMGVMPAAFAPALGQLLGVLGAAAVAWGSIQALSQRRLKPLVAWSSVAQVGYLFLVFPLGTPGAWSAGAWLVAAHAAAKASMFLAVAAIARASGGDELGGLSGLARDLPVAYVALALSGMSLMGMPPSGGFVGKWLLVRAALEEGRWWVAAVILVGGLFAAAYVFRILRGAFLAGPANRPPLEPARGEELGALALALLALALGLFPAPPLALLPAGR